MRSLLYYVLGAASTFAVVVLMRWATPAREKGERAAQEKRLAESAEKDSMVQLVLTDLMRDYVEGLNVIRADRRWKGIKIVAWGPRDSTRGTTTQSVLCQASHGSWAIIELRVDHGAVHACSFEVAGVPQLKKFLEPFPNLYVQYVGEPLLA